MDVLEIDGASNNGVDEIRALRENVKFSPSRGKFKIYIIDEVHMLSQGAFNALLKTLEEPPTHVKFIFATTAPHKVLPTIMSRCQRFDFKKIPPKMISDRIRKIAEKEKIEIDEKAVLLIARSADGSLRDALVILDQMISFSGKKILADDVIELLGMVHKDKIFELAEAVCENDPKRATEMLDEMITAGKDPVFVANSLLQHYRDLMILKTTGAPTADMALAADELDKLKTQLEKVSLEEILYILQNLSHCIGLMKGTMFTRAPLELTLIRLTKRKAVLSLPEILAKLEEGGLSIDGAADNADTDEVIRSAGGMSRNEPVDNFSGEKDAAPPEVRWKAVLNYVKSKKMSVFTFLNVAKPVEFSGKKVVIGFGKAHAFNKEALEANGNKDIVEEAIKKVTGLSPRLEFTLLEFFGESSENNDDQARKKNKIKEEMKPVIEKAMDVFGGHVVRDLTEDQI